MSFKLKSTGNKFGLLLLLGAGLLTLSSSASPSFIPPVKRGAVRSKFGSRTDPFGEGTEEHNGVDIAIPKGTNVYSIAPGVVSSSYFTEKGGKQLVIQHDNGFKSGYAHLYFPLVKLGERVERGQVIAQSGQSGKVTGAHLHFTLRGKDGKFVDPEKFVRFVA